MKGPTLDEVGSTIYVRGLNSRSQKRTASIVGDLVVKPAPHEEGLVLLTPEQMLSLRIPRLELKGDKIEGYQRDVSRTQVTRIQEAIRKGKELPPIMVSIYAGMLWITDGQHRALASIAERANLLAVIQKRDMEHQIALFADQARARRPSSDLLILRGSSPYDEYIQDAVTSPNGSHPWSKLVTERAGHPKKLSPTTTRRMLFAYVGQTTHFVPSKGIDDRWNEDYADELGRLMSIFGDRSMNPHAFAATMALGIAIAAKIAIRDQGSTPDDIARWEKWMPKFPFTSFAYIKNPAECADRLLAHWNKRLSPDRRVYRV